VNPGKIALSPIARNYFQQPLLCIATGTGIAPIRSVIREKVMLEQSIPTRTHSSTLLFQGCRRHGKDDIFRDEWKEIERTNSLQSFFAFSQESMVKKYVQHLLRENAQIVFNILMNVSCLSNFLQMVL
jgi:NADPH-ferrihemoprotein reductase